MSALVTVLAQAYRDTNRAIAPLQRAGIAREMLNANQAARPFWEQSLDLAERLGLLQRVVAAIPEGCDADSQIVATSRDLMPRLARDLATARASIRNLIESLNTAQTDRDAIGDRCLDLGRELEALRAAVRVHEERRRAGWPTPNPWNQADLDLWAAGKA